MYSLSVDQGAVKEIKRYPPKQFKQVVMKLLSLQGEPRPHDCRKLAGYDGPGIVPGEEQRFIWPGQVMGYRIDFWNKEDAPVPTQDAILIDRLDPSVFDLSTLNFTRIGFLDWDVALPGGPVIWMDLITSPGVNGQQDVRFHLANEAGQVAAKFHSIL